MARSVNSKGNGAGDRSTDGPQVPEATGGGYGQPPVHSRWKKGQSGNPRGRPRKLKTLPFSQRVDPFRDLFLEEMERQVEIKEGGQRTEIEAARAIFRSMTIGAMKGDQRMQKLTLQLATAAAESRKAELREDIATVAAYKARWQPIFKSAVTSGKPEPEQLPHPDHVDIDLVTGELVISGPVKPDEKQSWDFLKFRLKENAKLLAEAAAAAAAKPRDQAATQRVALLKQHQHSREQEVPPGWNWREELGWEDAYAEKLRAGGGEKD